MKKSAYRVKHSTHTKNYISEKYRVKISLKLLILLINWSTKITLAGVSKRANKLYASAKHSKFSQSSADTLE